MTKHTWNVNNYVGKSAWRELILPLIFLKIKINYRRWTGEKGFRITDIRKKYHSEILIRENTSKCHQCAASLCIMFLWHVNRYCTITYAYYTIIVLMNLKK